MGLSNKYVGETKHIGKNPKLGCADWFHRRANREQNLALTEEEADGMAYEFKEKVENHDTVLCAADLTKPELDKILEELDEMETIGRNLEEDEEEFLKENASYAVIDI